MPYRRSALVLMALTMLAGTALADDTVVIVAKGFRFDPVEVTVKVGTRVRWENREKVQFHNVLFPDLGEAPGDYFFPGESRERTFDRPGTYPYICEPHDQSHQMRGVVHVVE